MLSQPPTFGQRIRTHKYTQLTPLNRLVDAARPESETARDFVTLVDRMDRAQMRIWLTRWRDNDALLQPTLEKSALLKEDVPVSQAVSRAASIGLQALDYLDRNERPAGYLAGSAKSASGNPQEAAGGAPDCDHAVNRKVGQRCGGAACPFSA